MSGVCDNCRSGYWKHPDFRFCPFCGGPLIQYRRPPRRNPPVSDPWEGKPAYEIVLGKW